MMIIRNEGDFLRIDATERVPAGVQGEGDTEFEIEVQVVAPLKTEFHGKSWAWLEVDTIRSFVKEMNEVQRGSTEAASVIAMSPNEFSMTIRTYGKGKELGVFGKLGHWCHSGPGGPYWCEINFGIEMAYSDLEQLIRELSEL